MTPLILSLLLAQTPEPVGMAVLLSVKVSPERERTAIAVLEGELTLAGLPSRRFDARCNGDPTCLCDVARREGLVGLLAVTLGFASNGLVVDVEAFRTGDKQSIAQVTLPLLGKSLDAPARNQLRAFAVKVRAALPPPAPVVADAPVVEPPAVEAVAAATPAVEVVAPEPASRSFVPGVLLGVGAGLAASFCIGLGVHGLSEQRRLEATPDGVHSVLTRPEALRLASQTNLAFTVSLATGIASGILLTGFVAWLLGS